MTERLQLAKLPTTKVVSDHGRTVTDLQEEQHKLLLQQQRQDVLNPLAFSNRATSSGTDDSQVVRSSLVQLGQYYWGSGWDASTSATSRSKLAVPMGRTANENPAAVGDPIVPMSRASGSRVSRILEGSMDAIAMQ